MNAQSVSLTTFTDQVQTKITSHATDLEKVSTHMLPYLVDAFCVTRIVMVAGSYFDNTPLQEETGLDPLTLGCAVKLLHTGWKLSLKYLLSQTYTPRPSKSLANKIQTSTIQALSAPLLTMKSYQPLLPRLPIPPLPQTCQRFLDSVEPVLNDNEFKQTTLAVTEFLKPEGDGAALQRELNKIDLILWAKGENNWLEEWWEQNAYLSQPDSVLFATNWYGTGRKEGEQIPYFDFAAQVIYHLLDWLPQIRSETFPPEKLSGTTPLDMSQFERLYGTVRLPGLKDPQKEPYNDNVLDQIQTYSESNHIVIFVNNQCFAMPVLYQGSKRKKPEEIKQFLETIYKTAERCESNTPGLGILTSQERSKWYAHRQHLIEIGRDNLCSLKLIEEALFVISLEKKTLDNFNQQSREVFLNPNNRWFDKNLHLIVFEGNQIGVNVEHSWGEATVATSLYEHVLKQQFTLLEPSNAEVHLKPLTWTIDFSLNQAIQEATSEFQQKASNYEIESFCFRTFSKPWIQRQMMSPDAFIQMAIQLTYYQLHSKQEGSTKLPYTYETCTTRRFYHGRTETIRTATTKAQIFVEAMTNDKLPNHQKRKHLREAVEQHSIQTSQAFNGQGVDRHLLGLRILAKQHNSTQDGESLPKIFSCPGYRPSTEWNLLTSQFPTKSDQYCGVTGGAYSPPNDGYGLSYQIYKDRIFFHITTFYDNPKTSAEKFKHTLIESLHEMQNIF